MADNVPIQGIEFEIKGSADAAAKSLLKFSVALGSLDSAKDSARHLNTFAKALKQFEQDVKGLGKLNIDKSWGNTISRLGNALKAVDATKTRAFASALSALSKVGTTLSLDQSWIDAITDIGHAFDGLDVDKVRAYADALMSLRDLSRDSGGGSNSRLPTISKSLNELSNSSPRMAALVAVFRTLGNDIAKVASKAKDLALAFGRGFISALGSAASAAGRFAKNLAAAPINYITSRVKALTDKLGNLISSLKRIAFYRIIRTVIKEFGEALKEGTENAYWFSKTIGTTTRYISEAYDSFASASAMMKNQVGAAWATLFANIQPIILRIIELVSKAAEVVTMFFAKLGGKSTYLKALNYGKEWAEETEKGSKAAKEWRNQLMGFDEINRLDAFDNKDNGNSKDNTPDYGAMFVEMPVDSAIGELADKMKDLWNAQDWKGLGELIGKTINDLWPSTEKWQEWGHKIGNALNGAVETAYHALKTIDFKRFGSDIAQFINSAIDEINGEVWGRLFTRKFTAALDFLLNFLGGLDYGLIGEKIGAFFRGALDEATEWLNEYDWGQMGTNLWNNIKSLIDRFDVPTFARSLSDFIQKAANSAASYINGIAWSDVVNTLFRTLENFIRNFDLSGVKAAIGNLLSEVKDAIVTSFTAFGEWLRSNDWAQIGSGFNESLQNLLDGMLEIVNAIPWYDIGKAIGDFLSAIDWWDVLSKLASGLWTAFSGIISGLFDTNTGKVALAFLAGFEGIKLLFTGAKAFAIFEAAKWFAGAIAGTGGLGAVVPALSGVVTSIGAALAPIASVIFSPTGLIVAAVAVAAVLIIKHWDEIKEAAGKLKDKLVEDWTKLKEDASQTWSIIKDTVSSKWNELKESVSTTWETIKTTLTSKWEELKTVASITWDAISQKVTSVADTVNQKASTVWGNVKNTVSSAWENVKSSTETTWNGVKGTLSTVWDNVSSTASSVWNGVKSTVTNATGSISTESTSDTQTLYNDVTGIYNNIHTEAVRVFSDIARAVPQIMNYLAEQVNASVQSIANSLHQMSDDINSIIATMQSLDWSIPAPKLPHISVWYDTVWNGDGSSFDIPQFDVQWYAKGGVLDKATLFGMGEAGAEAIVPLERNTEWISKVATQMNQQRRNDPNDDSNDELIAVLLNGFDRILRAMPSADRDGIDMDSLARTITKYQRRQARAIG